MIEFWRWGPGELKLHTDTKFGRHLMKNQKMKYQAIYRDRGGKVYGYDFVIKSVDRERYQTLHKQFERKLLSENNGENRAETKPEITQSKKFLADGANHIHQIQNTKQERI
jgi:hypothetical protein